MKKLLLKTRFALGDVVLMTAAVRDLHRCYPGKFLTDVETHFPEIWENNPYLTFLDKSAPDVEVIDCRYPLISYANERPYHCLQGYIDFLNGILGLSLVPTEFRGDIHLSPEEKEWASQVHEYAGIDLPFWIVAAGGKYDIPIKWWSTARYQQVIDAFRGRIAFVQVGELGHHHPRLNGTIDLRGETSVRELIRLVYHAQGCLSGVTALMHLAAAVETRPGRPLRRPCVVVAGGREPTNWEAYPHHRFLHTIGGLECCATGGCWRSRVVALGDGRDRQSDMCINRVGELARCMDMVRAEDVIRAIEGYFEGGASIELNEAEAHATRKAIRLARHNNYDLHSLSPYDAGQKIRDAAKRIRPYPAGYSGRGVVICGGGLRYFPCAWVCIRMLRWLGCDLPIELWFQGPNEMDQRMIEILRPFGAECRDASRLERHHPRRTPGGWELKSYALLHSRFREVLLLDADNVPVRDPTYLFNTSEYKRVGSIFWPDYGCLAAHREIWRVCNVPYRHEPEFETGQIVVDKQKCWKALNLSFWFNDHSDFFYKYIHGDKDTFHMAWRVLEQPYGMIPSPIRSLEGVMCQHDFDGIRLFQHRNSHKWRAFGTNERIKGFRFERVCLAFLSELERVWDGKIHLDLKRTTLRGEFVCRGGTCDAAVYHDVVDKNEYQLPERFGAKDVVIDVGAHIGSFSYACLKRGARRIIAFEPEPENFRLATFNLRNFKGKVRLMPKAIWRSDRHPGPLLHSGYVEADHEVNTGGGTVLIGPESTPNHRKKEVVNAMSLDLVLKPFKRIDLLKLDCEGSEWPILFTSMLLDRVVRICGEYHEMDSIPTPAKVPGYSRFTRNELAEFLRNRYTTVRVVPRNGRLGHFWAEK